MEEFAKYWVAADLGQVREFTGVAVIERREEVGPWDAAMLAHERDIHVSLRYIERLPMGMPYPDIVERLREITEKAEIRGRCQLIVDATAVGEPVMKLVKRAKLGCEPLGVMVTSGLLANEEQGYQMVPKRDLIVGLQVMLQLRELEIAGKLPYQDVLLKDMMSMQVRSEGGRVVWREGEHDDLVLAVALGCWGVKRAYPNGPEGQDKWWAGLRRQPDLRSALGDMFRW